VERVPGRKFGRQTFSRKPHCAWVRGVVITPLARCPGRIARQLRVLDARVTRVNVPVNETGPVEWESILACFASLLIFSCVLGGSAVHSSSVIKSFEWKEYSAWNTSCLPVSNPRLSQRKD
jgi:hypothetical protein